VASAATSDEPSTADSPPTTTESPTTTTEATTTPPGTLTGPVPAPPGVDQASADAFAAAIADTLATSVVRGLDQNSLQASLDLMAIHCQLLDSIAATDPMGVDDAVRRVVASLDAGSLSAVLRAQVKAWYAAMFDAAADHLCPQHAVVLDDAAADLRRGATLSG
jgi:hypothetical protein